MIIAARMCSKSTYLKHIQAVRARSKQLAPIFKSFDNILNFKLRGQIRVEIL